MIRYASHSGHYQEQQQLPAVGGDETDHWTFHGPTLHGASTHRDEYRYLLLLLRPLSRRLTQPGSFVACHPPSLRRPGVDDGACYVSRIITRTAAGKEPAVRVWTEAAPQERPPFSFRSHGRDGTPFRAMASRCRRLRASTCLGRRSPTTIRQRLRSRWCAIRAASGGMPKRRSRRRIRRR